MKKIILASLLSVFGFCNTFAQDIMEFHNGEKAEVKVSEINDQIIKYNYKGEDVVYTIGRVAVSKITFESGRVQEISEKVVIASPEDWEKVRIVYDKAEVQGLKSLGQVEKHSSGTWSFHLSAGHFAEKTLKKIRQEAAKKGACYVLITSQQSKSAGLYSNGNANMTGELYTYK